MRQHQFYDSIRTVKNSNLEEEPGKETTSLPNCLPHVCNDAIINKINWENKVVRIDGEHLSHLIFADDIVLIANSTSKLHDMLHDIHEQASRP